MLDPPISPPELEDRDRLFPGPGVVLVEGPVVGIEERDAKLAELAGHGGDLSGRRTGLPPSMLIAGDERGSRRRPMQNSLGFSY